MNATLKRLIGASGAAAVVAGAALVAAPAAQADGKYYGAWTLTAWKVGGQTVNCPGKLPLPPPAPSISCKSGEILELKSGDRYKTTLDVFRGATGKGDFAILGFSDRAHKNIVFDADDAQDDPRAYKIKFQGTGDGAPKKMVIFTSIGAGRDQDTLIKMIFRRDAN
jgi:hypothetical protein